MPRLVIPLLLALATSLTAQDPEQLTAPASVQVVLAAGADGAGVSVRRTLRTAHEGMVSVWIDGGEGIVLTITEADGKLVKKMDGRESRRRPQHVFEVRPGRIYVLEVAAAAVTDLTLHVRALVESDESKEIATEVLEELERINELPPTAWKEARESLAELEEDLDTDDWRESLLLSGARFKVALAAYRKQSFERAEADGAG